MYYSYSKSPAFAGEPVSIPAGRADAILAMFKHVFKDPYVDILKLFAADDWRNAELKGNVKQAVDKAEARTLIWPS